MHIRPGGPRRAHRELHTYTYVNIRIIHIHTYTYEVALAELTEHRKADAEEEVACIIYVTHITYIMSSARQTPRRRSTRCPEP